MRIADRLRILQETAIAAHQEAIARRAVELAADADDICTEAIDLEMAHLWLRLDEVFANPL